LLTYVELIKFTHAALIGSLGERCIFLCMGQRKILDSNLKFLLPLFKLLYLCNQVDKINIACSKHGRYYICMKILVEKPQNKMTK